MKLLKAVEFSDIKEGEIFAWAKILYHRRTFERYIEIFYKLKPQVGKYRAHRVIFLADAWDKDFMYSSEVHTAKPGDIYYFNNHNSVFRLHKNTQKLWGKKK